MKKSKQIVQNNSFTEFLLYTTPNGKVKVEIFLRDENIWLTQDKIALLFGVQRPAITKHLKNIFESRELNENLVSSVLEHTAKDGKKYKTLFYNLDAILSVGYRVNSSQATRFRIWATERLKEYIIKGFTMDDERLKQGGSRARYFQELLQRVRDIRSSERMFYQKVTDIYATSIDYQSDADLTRKFFATVQNKMHYAVHGHTAAEIIATRANSQKPLMGLTGFKGDYITANDIVIAKNYLTEPEINQLNLIVSLYIDFAELQANSGRLMKMQDWINKLDEFLTIAEKNLLHSAGTISAEQAEKTAVAEFEKYRQTQDKNYISDFDREVKKILEMEKEDKT